MIYFLLLFFPMALSGMCFVLRKQSNLASLLALLAVMLEAVLVIRIPVERPAQLLGVHLTVVPLNRLFLLAFCLALFVAFLATFQIPHGENFPAIALLTLGLIAATMVMQDPLVITLLLLASGLAVILALVDLPADGPGLVAATSIEAALRYLTLMLLAGLVLALGYVLVDTTRLRSGEDVISAKLILAFLLLGFALRLAAIPFHSWLPDLVDEAAPLVSLIVVGNHQCGGAPFSGVIIPVHP
ncbi:MAG: hypothetical protein KatS3mg057_0884 [Herpetosiphonaceae bacterium]|nr:MAG: hypothetical protein KatS3mg057_0884 [Herpetosiphonaceae bacterium]